MPRIVHLGLGNFHRAHQAVYTADAPGGDDWQITAVARSNGRLIDTVLTQGGYSVIEVGPGARPPRWMTVIDRGLVARDAPDDAIAAIADPDVAVVTMTITEKGYGYKPGSHDLDTDDEAVRADAAGGAAPRTMLGLLARGLLARAASGAPALTLVSCDNISGNGTGLGGALRQFADLMPDADGSALHAYLDRCTTPNTMVDRIVPATTDKHREAAAAAGFDDAAPVPCEPFTMWVIEHDFAGERPAWDAVGAILTDADGVHAYEMVKLRLLNATNSMLAYLGALTGRTYQAEAAADPAIRAVAWKLGDEMQPTINLPEDLDAAAYRRQMFERFGNLELGHTCQQVGSDGSAKLSQRVPGPVAWHAEHPDQLDGQLPPAIALLVAAWLHVVTRLELPADQVPDEPLRERLRELSCASARPADLAHRALVDAAVLGPDLATRHEFVELVGRDLDLIAHGHLGDLLADVGAGVRVPEIKALEADGAPA